MLIGHESSQDPVDLRYLPETHEVQSFAPVPLQVSQFAEQGWHTLLPSATVLLGHESSQDPVDIRNFPARHVHMLSEVSAY